MMDHPALLRHLLLNRTQLSVARALVGASTLNVSNTCIPNQQVSGAMNVYKNKFNTSI